MIKWIKEKGRACQIRKDIIHAMPQENYILCISDEPKGKKNNKIDILHTITSVSR